MQPSASARPPRVPTHSPSVVVIRVERPDDWGAIWTFGGLLRLNALAVAVAILGLLGCLTGTAMASAGSSKEVRYRGYSIVVPAAWPVYNLTLDPTICVRFNRH